MSDKKLGRVIIADDEGMMRQFLKAILMDAGFQVVGEAATGSEAVRLCRELDPNLVCLDIVMPTMDGITALKEIRQENPDLAVIMVSGETTQSHVQEAIKLGANGFIVKPFNAKLVVSHIVQALTAKPAKD